MPKKAKELSAVQVKRLTKQGFYAVGGVAGLHLQVKESGARSWILRAQIGNRRRDIGLGGCGDVSLALARERAREARNLIWQGIDPIEARKAARRAEDDARLQAKADDARKITFEQAASGCHKKKSPEFRSTKHSNDWINSITTHVPKNIRELPVDAISLAHVQQILEPIWKTKTETATRVRQRIEAILDWAKTSGFRDGDNPAQWKGNLEHVLPKPSKIRKRQHFPALPWQEVPEFMAKLRKREGAAARALEFAILTAARSGEVRLATWDEIDFEAKLWTIPGNRMKAGREHRIPLPAASVRILESLPRFQGSSYIFTSPRGNNALSDMSMSAVTKRMGADAVPHGFRSSFKDWCRSSTAYPDEVSELALAHVSSDATRAAYARDELLPKRARLMADWAKFCATVPIKGEVVPIRAKK